MKEAEILQHAVESLENLTGAKATIKRTVSLNRYRWDALLHLAAGTATGDFKTEVKANVLPATLAQLMEKLQSENGLLVAKYISNPAKTILEEQGINYLDMAGNCFIRNDQGIFWLIRGQSLPEEARDIKHETFHKNGIKLLYALLLQEDWLNESYRFLASKANIAASTVGDILSDLKASKFLWQINEQQMALANKPELLAQWVAAFNKKLKPKLSSGKFRFANNVILQDWKKLNLGYNAFWGGEPAADLLTHYLQPGAWTIYTNLDRRALLKELQLVPDPRQGNVEVYSIFWNEAEESFINPVLKTVSPLLVYADLTGSGDSRNLETAKRIYEQYLKDILELGNG
jgi:hypothetical protein